jgi:predicted acetyltransferase
VTPLPGRVLYITNIYVANVAYVLTTIYESVIRKKSYVSLIRKPFMWKFVTNVSEKTICKYSYTSDISKDFLQIEKVGPFGTSIKIKIVEPSFLV